METITNRDIYNETHAIIDENKNVVAYSYVDYMHSPNRRYDKHRDSVEVHMSIRNSSGDWVQTRALDTARTKEEFANVVGSWFYAEW